MAQVGAQEILVKWSWTMNFWWNRYNPFKSLWDPRLVFTGISVLGYNRETGEQRATHDTSGSCCNCLRPVHQHHVTGTVAGLRGCVAAGDAGQDAFAGAGRV